MKLLKLIKGFDVVKIENKKDPDIKDIAYDSRKVKQCSLFVAIKGKDLDGHSFISDAVKNGASAIIIELEITSENKTDLAEKGIPLLYVKDSRSILALLALRFFNYPSSKLTLIGVTGTNGKTTTTYITKNILEKSGKKTGLIGTIDYQIGDKKIPSPNTTPESLDLQRLLREMANGGCKHAVMEVSSHALALNRVRGCEFDIGVYTNLTQDHLDFHKSMEAYFDAKLRLFRMLNKDSRKKGEKRAIVNLDDPRAMKIIEISKKPVYTYGSAPESDFRAENISLDVNGMSFDVITPEGRFPVKSKLVGGYNISNILAAIAITYSLNISIEHMQAGIREMMGVPGRFESVSEGQDFTVIVDYAHTEDALSRLLNSISEFSKGRIITIFGCGGDRDKGKRPLMGKAASSLSDFVILTSDNPRSEDPNEILNDIEKGIKEVKSSGLRLKGYYVIPDRREAIAMGVNLAKEGDILVIAGKGHEDYQIIGNEKSKFDDRLVVREAIRKKKSGGKPQKSDRSSAGQSKENKG